VDVPQKHPILYASTLETKEPAFFCNIYGYRDFDAYLRLFATKEKVVGEATLSDLT